MTKLIALSGWANPKESLDPVSKHLSSVFDVLTMSFHELPAVAFQCKAAEDGRNTETISVYARGLMGLIREIDSPCFLMGWSAGGLAALEAASACQDRIRGLILVSTTARFCSDEGYRYGKTAQTVRAMSQGLKKDAVKVLTGFFGSAGFPSAGDSGPIRDKAVSALDIGIDPLCQGLEYLRHADMRPALKGIAVPSIVLHGRKDMIIPWQAGRTMAEKMQDGTFVLHESAGHDLPVRYPRFVADQAMKFADNITGRPADLRA